MLDCDASNNRMKNNINLSSVLLKFKRFIRFKFSVLMKVQVITANTVMEVRIVYVLRPQRAIATLVRFSYEVKLSSLHIFLLRQLHTIHSYYTTSYFVNQLMVYQYCLCQF